MAVLAPSSRPRFALWAGLALMLADGAVAMEPPTVLEVQVKAAFLPKFAAYVNWPPGIIGEPDDPVQICVIGQDPFGRNLDGAAERHYVGRHAITIRRLESTQDAQHCNIAFLGGSARQSIAAMQQALHGKPILTVTDSNLGGGRGMVHFALKDGRVRFHIDDALAAGGNLTISARLLSLALSVKPRTRA